MFAPCVLTIGFLAMLACAVPVDHANSKAAGELDVLFSRFKSEHSKVYYDAKDEAIHKGNFAANLERIRQHNAEAAQGHHLYTLGMNQFGDMTNTEFRRLITSGGPPRRNQAKNFVDMSHVVAADSVDWVAKGAVTHVKNQLQCGSCWAMTATGAMEAAHFIATGKLISLSDQQLMDCSWDEGNAGCEGGLMDSAYNYTIKHQICSERAYPYVGTDSQTCKSCSPVVSISGFFDIAPSAEDFAKAVTQQPVGMAIDADITFQLYSAGILNVTCGAMIDHSALVVGYGTANNTNYWYAKNSWGTTWGMEGYFYTLKGGETSSCGMFADASYPIV